jgi:hypothetical protein
MPWAKESRTVGPKKAAVLAKSRVPKKAAISEKKPLLRKTPRPEGEPLRKKKPLSRRRAAFEILTSED